VGVTHLDDAPSRELAIGHLGATWSFLGEDAGCVGVGVRRIQVHDGSWSTPCHEHGQSEEIFYVLAGRGLSWQAGEVAAIGPGDCVVYRARRGAHSLHGVDGLDALAFGPRFYEESPRFPRLGYSLVGSRFVESLEGAVDGLPIQFVREAELGPPELPAVPGARPENIVNVADVEASLIDRPGVSRRRRRLGEAAGSVTTGLNHVEVAPGKEGDPLHCHSLEEEIFVVLDGEGVLVLDEQETPVRAGSVVARPAGTGVSHQLRAGDGGLTYLAYGTREPGDVCYYPRSNKISFRGVGVIGRIERLDYWDGED
jgi:uncharacterized cupin superfamily protein